MSTRAFDIGAMGLGGEGVELVMFGFFDFAGDPKFVHTSVGIITWGNEDWEGVGNFARVEPVQERLGYAPARMRLGLSPIVGELLNESLNENTWGRLCEIFLGTWDGAAMTRDPELIIRGRMGR